MKGLLFGILILICLKQAIGQQTTSAKTLGTPAASEISITANSSTQNSSSKEISGNMFSEQNATSQLPGNLGSALLIGDASVKSVATDRNSERRQRCTKNKIKEGAARSMTNVTAISSPLAVNRTENFTSTESSPSLAINKTSATITSTKSLSTDTVTSLFTLSITQNETKSPVTESSTHTSFQNIETTNGVSSTNPASETSSERSRMSTLGQREQSSGESTTAEMKANLTKLTDIPATTLSRLPPGFTSSVSPPSGTKGKLNISQTTDQAITKISVSQTSVTASVDTSKEPFVTGDSSSVSSMSIEFTTSISSRPSVISSTTQGSISESEKLTAFHSETSSDLFTSSFTGVNTSYTTYKPLTVVHSPGIHSLKLAVSITFLIIAIVATAILFIYMVRIKRRTFLYDELRLLP